MKKLLSILILLVSSASCLGQYLEVTDGKSVTQFKRVANVEVVDSKEETLKKFTYEKEEPGTKVDKIKIITAKTKSTPSFKFEDVSRKDVSANWTRLDAFTYVSNKPGKYWVTVKAYSGRLIENNQVVVEPEEETLVVEIAGEKPTPPTPDPTPDPDDGEISNVYGVGKVAFENAPNNSATLVKTYRENAEMLFGRPRLITIEDALKNIRQSQKSLGTDWDKFTKEVDSAIKKAQTERGYLSGQDWYLLLLEVASAVEKKNG